MKLLRILEMSRAGATLGHVTPSLCNRSAKVEVSLDRCEQLARVLRTKSVPLDEEENQLPDLGAADIGNFYLPLVAICHQTSPQGRLPLEGVVGGRRVRGWDYLSARFAELVRLDQALLTPDYWSQLSGSDVCLMFRDTSLGERLTDPDGRARLLRDLGFVMLQRNWRTADDLYQISDRRIADTTTSLISLLAEFAAYRDPVHKKAYFFLALMQNHGVWQYADPDNLGAPVDYHEIRGHLRIGTVLIRDPELRRCLFTQGPVSSEDDIAIRGAVACAIRTIGTLTGLSSASQLHYLLWNVFRSCCTRKDPHCFSCPTTCALPMRYAVALHGSERLPRACPYNAICLSARNTAKVQEYSTVTEYY